MARLSRPLWIGILQTRGAADPVGSPQLSISPKTAIEGGEARYRAHRCSGPGRRRTGATSDCNVISTCGSTAHPTGLVAVSGVVIFTCYDYTGDQNARQNADAYDRCEAEAGCYNRSACWPNDASLLTKTDGHIGGYRRIENANVTKGIDHCRIIALRRDDRTPGARRSRAGPSLLMIGGGGGVGRPGTLVGQTSATPSLIWCHVSLVFGL